MVGSFDARAIARQLHEARLTATSIDFVTSNYPDLIWEEARAIAREGDALRRADGEMQIGWKLGWTSSAMREALGVNRPNWGTLWDSQIAEDPLTHSAYLHPKVEPELVWRASRSLPSGSTAALVREAGGSWALGIEVVDPRFPSFEFDALDNTADNSSSAAVAVGECAAIEGTVADIEVEFSSGGEVRRGAGRLAMDDPCEAVAWLARSLASEGLAVKEGDIVFTGGLTAPFDASAGSVFTLGSPQLGEITLAFR